MSKWNCIVSFWQFPLGLTVRFLWALYLRNYGSQNFGTKTNRLALFLIESLKLIKFWKQSTEPIGHEIYPNIENVQQVVIKMTFVSIIYISNKTIRAKILKQKLKVPQCCDLEHVRFSERSTDLGKQGSYSNRHINVQFIWVLWAW